jgi:hypothetical protein
LRGSSSSRWTGTSSVSLLGSSIFVG